MEVTPQEYHPYAACLMYRQCADGIMVRENLADVWRACREFDQMAKTVIKTGVVAKLDGQYWGIQHENDNRCIDYAFGPIEKAVISDPKYCKHPRDMTYSGSPSISQLDQALLYPVRVTTIYEVGTPENHSTTGALK